MALGIRGAVGVDQFDAHHQATAANIPQVRKVALQQAQMLAKALAHGRRVGWQIMLREITHHRRAGGHGHLIASERSGMSARSPGVEPVAIDHHRQGQAAANGLGHHHHVRNDARMLKSEHLAGTAKTALDFIDNQCHAGFFGDPPQAAQPIEIRRDHAALALHRLDNDCCRQRHAAFGVVQQVFQIMQIDLHALRAAEAERAAIIVRIRQELHATAQQRAQRLFWPQAAHQAQRTLTHAMIGALERQNGTAARGAAHQLEGRLHCIGAGRTAELNLRLVGQGLGQHAEQVLDKPVLDRCGQVEGVQWQLIDQYLLDRLDHHRVVMPQRQGPGARQAIDETSTLDVFDIQPAGPLERQRDASRVAAGIGFLTVLPGQQRRLVELIKRFNRCGADPGRLIFDKAGSD